jgi:CrcB protein
MKLVFVACGGAAGALLRYGITSAMAAGWTSRFPQGTLLVNISGSFLVGLLWGISLRQNYSPEMTALIFPGFLGGYTTFSAFSLECLQLLRNGEPGMAFVYLLASIAGGLLAAYLGLRLSGNSLTN